jgi:hypothetical protein
VAASIRLVLGLTGPSEHDVCGRPPPRQHKPQRGATSTHDFQPGTGRPQANGTSPVATGRTTTTSGHRRAVQTDITTSAKPATAATFPTASHDTADTR